MYKRKYSKFEEVIMPIIGGTLIGILLSNIIKLIIEVC